MAGCLMKSSAVLIFLTLGSAALAAAPGTPGLPFGAGPPPDYLCDPEGLSGEVEANKNAVSAIETQIKATESQRATARTQMLALNPSVPNALMQRSALQRQFDADTQRIAMLEMNAKSMRDHIAELEAKLAACGPRQDSTAR
jgi:hypothetical protein